MTEQELNKILSNATALPAETEIIEFKEAIEETSLSKWNLYAICDHFDIPRKRKSKKKISNNQNNEKFKNSQNYKREYSLCK